MLQEKLLWEGKTGHGAAPALPDTVPSGNNILWQAGILVCYYPWLRQEKE